MKLSEGRIVYPSTPIYTGSNFTWGEATKNCSRPLCDLIIHGSLVISAAEIEKNIVKTALKLDHYRKLLGNKPIRVTSWYRNSFVNERKGGSLYSRHQYGDGVDWVSSYYSPRQVARILEPLHEHGGYKAYAIFTHTDWRGYKARW